MAFAVRGAQAQSLEEKLGTVTDYVPKAITPVDFVTISVHLKVGHRGEAEFNFEKKLQVYKDRITEVRPEHRIRIRAYFERAEQP